MELSTESEKCKGAKKKRIHQMCTFGLNASLSP